MSSRLVSRAAQGCYSVLIPRFFLNINRFYRAYFVAAKTPYATVIIDDDPGSSGKLFFPVSQAHGLRRANAGAVAAANTSLVIDFGPRREGIPPFPQWQGKEKIHKLRGGFLKGDFYEIGDAYFDIDGGKAGVFDFLKT